MIPGYRESLSLMRRLGELKRCLLAPRLSSTTKCQAIQIKTNVRAFYVRTSRPFCIKASMRQGAAAGNLANEIAVRQRISHCGTISIPRLLDHDVSHDPPFLAEAFVAGTRFGPEHADKIVELISGLWRFYEEEGVSHQPISEFVDVNGTKDLLQRASAEVEWRQEWMPIAQLSQSASAILRKHAVVPVSTGHGDLCLGNVILGDEGTLYLLDWEKSRRIPIAFDVAAFARRFAPVATACEKRFSLLASRRVDTPMLSFQQQQFAWTLGRIARMVSHIDMAAGDAGFEAQRLGDKARKRLPSELAYAHEQASRSA